MFNSRIRKALSYYNKNSKVSVSFEEISNEINAFKDDYSNLLIPPLWEDQRLDIRIDEFDMLLTLYEWLYKDVSESLLAKTLKIWPQDNRWFEITATYLLRFIIQDIFSLRNFCAMKFENQFNATFRNIIEKVNILSLFLFDYYFSSNYAFNDEKWDKKNRYFTLIRPSAIKNRINTNYNQIKNSEKETGIIFARIDKFFYEFLLAQTLNTSYELSSLFIHTNDFQEIFKYYNEGGEFNISLKHNATSYTEFRLDYAIEFLLLLFNQINSSFLNRGTIKNTTNIEKIIISWYYSVLVEEKYKY